MIVKNPFEKAKASAVRMIKRNAVEGSTTKTKVEQTMSEFKQGTLKSGSDTGPLVKKRKQALAIGLNQSRKKRRKL